MNKFLTEVWTSPREVFKELNNTQFNKYTNLLLFLSGVTSALSNAMSRDLGDEISFPVLLVLVVVIGGISGIIGTHIFSAVILWVGKLYNGKGTRNDLVRCIAYAAIPSIHGLLLYGLLIALFGSAMFQSEVDHINGGVSLFVTLTSGLIFFILGVWAFVLQLIALSEVQGYSIGVALATVLTSIVVIILPIALIVLAVVGL